MYTQAFQLLILIHCCLQPHFLDASPLVRMSRSVAKKLVQSLSSDDDMEFGIHIPHRQNVRPIAVTTVTSTTSMYNSSSGSPVLRVEDVTSKSIRVRLDSRSHKSLVPRKIYFKNVQRNSDWKHCVVDEKKYHEENDTFLLTNLLCGNKYQIYCVSVDSDGQHSTSEILLLKTTGREPLAPPVDTFFHFLPVTSSSFLFVCCLPYL